MLIIDMPKKYLTDASGFVSCAMCQKYLPLLYRDCHNDFKGCLIKGELPDEHGRLGDLDRLAKMVNCARIEAMQEGSDTNPYWLLGDIIAPIIAAERKDDGN